MCAGFLHGTISALRFESKWAHQRFETHTSARLNARSDKTTSRFRRPILGDFSPLLVDSRGAFTSDDGDYFRQQCLKGLLHLTGHVLGVVDVDLLEDDLIGLSADNRRSF